MKEDNSMFLVTIGEDIDEVATEVFFYNSRVGANQQLHNVTYGNLDDENTCIYQGILTKALYIPDSFKNCVPYLLIRNPERHTVKIAVDEAWFKRIPSNPKDTIEYIQEIIKENSLFEERFSIDDVYLFFGKKLIPVFHITDEAVDDEELIDRLNDLEEVITTNTNLFLKKENNDNKSKSTNN
jgi:hypothetical protein